MFVVISVKYDMARGPGLKTAKRQLDMGMYKEDERTIAYVPTSICTLLVSKSFRPPFYLSDFRYRYRRHRRPLRCRLSQRL